MRHTELRARLDAALGVAYAGVWCRQQVHGALGGRTVEEALAAGIPPKDVWRVVADALSLPSAQR